MAKRGRKPLPDSEKRGNRMTLMLKNRELAQLERLAGDLRVSPVEAAYRALKLVLNRHLEGGSIQAVGVASVSAEPLERQREQVVDKHIARGVLRREQRWDALRACGSSLVELLTADKFWSAQEEDRRG